MKLSKAEAAVLSLLVNEQEMYGLEMVKKSGGRLKLGTIYVTLNRLEEKGFAVSRKEIEPTLAVPRRLYRITGTGAAVYRALSEARHVFSSRLGEPGQQHVAAAPATLSATSPATFFERVDIIQ